MLISLLHLLALQFFLLQAGFFAAGLAVLFLTKEGRDWLNSYNG